MELLFLALIERTAAVVEVVVGVVVVVEVVVEVSSSSRNSS